MKKSIKNITKSGEQCIMWTDIFEKWPTTGKNEFGDWSDEFLPILKEADFTNLRNLTYIRWHDNRFDHK